MIKTIVAFQALWALAGVSMVNADAFWVIPNIEILTVGRVDPIASPGRVAPHSHAITGASNFRSVLNTPEEQQNAVCSTAPIQADKSNYWAPQVFFVNDDGEYEHMATGSRVYYHAPRNSVAFPKGMRMISGVANERKPDALRSQGVAIDCDERPGGSIWLPNGTTYREPCHAVHTNAFMPSCGWANQSLDSWDHFSHLTWPINSGGGQIWENVADPKCPETHPIKYPALMIQFNFWTSERQRKMWKTDGRPNFIFANGDTAGNTFHVDFVSGWDEGVLQAAIDTCDSVGDRIGDCPPFKPSIDSDKARACALQSMLPAEEVGYNKPLKNLPGCNPVWGIERDDKPTDCPWFNGDPGWTAPQGSYADNWRTMALAMDLNSSVVLPTKINTHEQPQVVTYNGMYNSGSLAAWPNQHTTDVVMKGTFEDFQKNADAATAPNKVCEAAGLKDSSAWSGLTPPTIVGKDKWSVLENLPKTFTWLKNVAHETKNVYLNFQDDLPRPTDGSENDQYDYILPDGTEHKAGAATPKKPASDASSTSDGKPTDAPSSSGSGSAATPTFSGTAAVPVKNVNLLNAEGGEHAPTSISGAEKASVVIEGASSPTASPTAASNSTGGNDYGTGSGAGEYGAADPAGAASSSSGSGTIAATATPSGTNSPAGAASSSGTPVSAFSATTLAGNGTQPTVKPAPGRCRRKTKRGVLKRRL
ncbi:hypothetical protein Q8F55_003032 [Vanrija albida]|uniref:DUF1996 domain-containing protein n=1 Tax=Vanrija albida TaxID=181172 RepID=A0ABR3QBE7_9TREE